MRFRIVFFGTPAFAVPSLQALLDGPDAVVGVVCQPDRPAGRGQRLQAPPVKQLAERHGLPVAQPVKLKSGEFPAQLRAWAPDLAVVAAYGRILPPDILATPPLGCINVHASLLPRYRGAAPIQWAVLNGDAETGVTIMQMNARMDEGDILLQRRTPIGADETAGALQERLALIGASALTDTLNVLAAGTLLAIPQDHAAATLAPMIRKEQGAIDWARPAVEIARAVRGFHPWPSAYTTLGGKLLKLHRAHAVDAASSVPAGSVIGTDQAIRVATGAGVLVIEELQLEGRRALDAATFARGGGIAVGDRLGGAPG
ncbi:MAG: methionyl-tRNA formyltransferase [Deltaproteobacteria bacterium]|nr:methionyl-tRNA formyltransferase [Deltaproteobacteria bacterium]